MQLLVFDDTTSESLGWMMTPSSSWVVRPSSIPLPLGGHNDDDDDDDDDDDAW